MNKNTRLFLCLLLLLCASFVACNWDNPILEKWWVDPKPAEPEYIYAGILKNIPVTQYIYETIIETVVEWKDLPPSEVLQSIEIIGIEYIIFSGDQPSYNGDAGTTSGTSLLPTEKDYNDRTIEAVAQALVDNSDYLIMLHGHANPTTFTQGETLELGTLSKSRADSVKAKLDSVIKTTSLTSGGASPYPAGLPPDKITVSWYGGGKTLFGNNSLYTALNRRVEMIIFRIITKTP